MKHAKQSDNSGVIEDVDQRSGAPHSTWPLGPWLASPGSSSSNQQAARGPDSRAAGAQRAHNQGWRI